MAAAYLPSTDTTVNESQIMEEDSPNGGDQTTVIIASTVTSAIFLIFLMIIVIVILIIRYRWFASSKIVLQVIGDGGTAPPSIIIHKYTTKFNADQLLVTNNFDLILFYRDSESELRGHNQGSSATLRYICE